MTISGRSGLFDRQKHLLGLLHALGGTIASIDFQKLLFLYCVEEPDAPVYEFVPYRFGAFSFTSYADRRKLVELGLLLDDERTWQLSAEGRTQARRLRIGSERAQSLAVRYRDIRGDALVAIAYRMFPYHAIRSEIADRVLRDDICALRAIDRARPPQARGVLLTIGYEGRTLEGYLNTLLAAGTTILCDVRRNPISRKYGFSKRTLARSCEGVGIRYEHLPELGIASDKRAGLETEAEYKALFDEYARTQLPQETEAMTTLRDWVADGEGLALTCYERAPENCHRHRVFEELVRSFNPTHTARHL